MPPKAAKRKSKGPKGDEPWGCADEQPKKKPRLSTLQAGEWDMNPYDELDEGQDYAGRPTSGSFENWGHWQTKFNQKEKSDKRHFAEAFNKLIEQKRDEFAMLFYHANDELKNAGNKYANLIHESLTTTEHLSKSDPQPQAVKSRRDHHPLFEAGQHLFQKCHDLIADQDQANKKATQGGTEPDVPRQQWKKDIASVQELLLYGRQHGENIVDCIVIPGSGGEDKGHLLTPDKGELSVTGRMAVDMYSKSAEGVLRGGPTWGDMARSQAGAFGRVLDGLNGI